MAINVKDVISDSNSGLKITQIELLNKIRTEKFYGFLVIYLANKDNAETFLEKKVIKIGRKTAYTEIWQDVVLKKNIILIVKSISTKLKTML